MANFAWFTKFHRFIYHHSRGLVGGNLGGVPMVLMYTIGAKSGQVRPVPLQYYPDPEGILVLGSNNGQSRAPAWYFNLKAHPEIDIRVGREVRRVRAEQLSPPRKDEVWPRLRAQNPDVDVYAANAGRDLPVMLLRTLK